MSRFLSRFSKASPNLSDNEGRLPRSRTQSDAPPPPPRLTVTSDAVDAASISIKSPSPQSRRRGSQSTSSSRKSADRVMAPKGMDRHAISRLYERRSMTEDDFLASGMPTPTPTHSETVTESFPVQQLSRAQHIKEQYIAAAADDSRRTTAPATADSVTRRSTRSESVSSNNADTTAALSSSPENMSTMDKARTQWRRGSQPKRVPTNPSGGIASALAASGMMMAHANNVAMPMPAPGTLAPAAVIRRSPSQTSMLSAVSQTDAGARSASQQRDRRHQYAVHAPRDDGSDSGQDDDAEMLLDEDAMPVTGFAVASSKRNADFHELFQQIAPDDYLIEDYGCALQREILLQGRLYISENHICFHANIFGWVTDEVIAFAEIVALERKMTALIIPNAIMVATARQKYTFASFMGRDTAYDVLHNIWRLARPVDSGSVRPSLELQSADGELGEGGTGGGGSGGFGAGATRKVTQCACMPDHYATVALDCVVPGTPEKIYNLMYASGFIKDFLRVDQKLIDLQMSDWVPGPGKDQGGADGPVLMRNMSYIKPLTGSFGPKQTKCELKDEVVHLDFERWVSVLTSTRTPDVPSGGAFVVRTRSCISWAGRGTSRVLVTSAVEWTGSSFIKGVINNACMDGQKTYHTDLEKAMRAYITEHKFEFVPTGMEAAEAADEAAALADTPPTPAPPPSAPVRDERWLQWALDTLDGTSKVAGKSVSGALELLRDAWEQSDARVVMFGLIALLLVTNIASVLAMRAAPRVRAPRGEALVSAAMRSLLDEVRAARAPPAWVPVPGVGAGWREELAEMQRALDAVEERVRAARAAIAGVELGAVPAEAIAIPAAAPAAVVSAAGQQV